MIVFCSRMIVYYKITFEMSVWNGQNKQNILTIRNVSVKGNYNYVNESKST